MPGPARVARSKRASKLGADMAVVALALGVLIGVALGSLGGGGSILTVPALVYVLGQDAHVAVGASLVIVGANAAVGAWMHRRQGNVRLREAFLFGGVGLGAAYLGARLSRFLPAPVLMALFAVLMIVVALFMLRGGIAGRGVAGPGAKRMPERRDAASRPRVIAAGLTVGFLTGFLGVGGGFLIVPALVLFLGMDMRAAVGSSLVVIALNSGAGLLGHIGDGALNWALIGSLLAGGLLGLAAGTWLARVLPTTRLRQAFAGFVVVLGFALLAANVPSLFALGRPL